MCQSKAAHLIKRRRELSQSRAYSSDKEEESVVQEQSCFFNKERVVSEDGRGAYLMDRE